MRQRPRAVTFITITILLLSALFSATGLAAAQDQPGRTQQINGRLQAGETHAYLLRDLQTGDRLSISMRATSGNLDPAIGVVDTTTPLAELMPRYQADIQRLVAENESVTQALDDLRDRYFLAWDDDGGGGYAAALEYVIPAPGDYVLIAGGALAAFGRATSGDYELQFELNAPAAPDGPPIAEPIPNALGRAPSVQETTGTLTAAAPSASLRLADLDAGATLTVRVEATSGNLIPRVVLRDFGGKALEAANLDGQRPTQPLSTPSPRAP